MRDKHRLMRNRVAYEEGQNNACTVGGNMRKANRLPAARVYCKQKKKTQPFCKQWQKQSESICQMESDSEISLDNIVFTTSRCTGAVRSKATSLFVQLELWVPSKHGLKRASFTPSSSLTVGLMGFKNHCRTILDMSSTLQESNSCIHHCMCFIRMRG